MYLPIDNVFAVHWSVEQGELVRELRGDRTLEAVAGDMRRRGAATSVEFLETVEQGRVNTLPMFFVEALAESLRVGKNDLLPITVIGEDA